MVKLLIKILTAKPLLNYLAKKTNGYKTIIGAIGTICAAAAYIAQSLHPGLIDPSLVPPQELGTVLEGALAGFATLMAAGGAHKVVKKKRAEKAEQEMMKINKRLKELQDQISRRYGGGDH